MILDAFNLRGKVAIVTGCGTGLGRGMALGLAEAGADIAGVYNSSEPDCGAEITRMGRRFLPVKANLSDLDQLDPLVEQTVEAFGRVDILVNNAGIIRRQPALEFTRENWDEVVNLNLRSLFFLAQAVAKRFVAQKTGGKIINIASMLSFQGGILVPSYTASKSGVMGLTRELACEWASQNINVNAIAPGMVMTDMVAKLWEQRKEQYLSRIPLNRIAQPEEIANAILFLASDMSSYMTGTTLDVSGGFMMR